MLKSHLSAPFVLLLSAAFTGCGSDGPSEPTTGTLEVTTTVVGSHLDATGVTVIVDGAGSRTVAAGGSTTFSGVSAGQHTIRIEDVADNCQVTGGAMRVVNVTANHTTTSTFQISCDAIVAGYWEYSSDLTFDGLPCTLTEHLNIAQTGSAFYGYARNGWITCPLAGISEIAPGAAIVNGASEQYSIAFDFDDASIHHTGTYATNEMSGAVRWLVDGVTVNGIWSAARASSGAVVVPSLTPVEGAPPQQLAVERAAWLQELARRLTRSDPR